MRKKRIPLRIAQNDLLWAIPVFVAGFSGLSVWLGPDASWDLRNYHIYNAFAALGGRSTFDLAPAQLQTFYAPLLDIGEQSLRRALNAHPALLDALLALPHAVAALLAFRLGLLVLPAGTPFRSAFALLAAVVGATGVAGVSTLGTSMSEALPACCLLLGLVLVIEGDYARSGPLARAPLAGALAGAAAGLKLTQVPGALGLLAALASFSINKRPAKAARALAGFLFAAVAAALLLAGWWWWGLWQRTGNPLFPHFNDVFRSSWVASVRMADIRFLPRNLVQALVYPLYWAFHAQTLVTELPSRDPRLALGWLAVLAIGLRAVMRRHWPAQPLTALVAFWIITYAAWEFQFSILRYTLVLELLSFVLVLGAIIVWLPTDVCGRHSNRAFLSFASFAVIAALALAGTVYPRWGRSAPGPLAMDVTPPEFGPDSLVVLLDPAPMAYVAAFTRADAHFVGANNNLVRPGVPGALSHRIAAAVRDQTGPLWGLEEPGDEPGAADTTLQAYGLRRGPGCRRIRSNLDGDAILACPLLRKQRPAPPAP